MTDKTTLPRSSLKPTHKVVEWSGPASMPANGIKHEIDLLDSGTRQRNSAKACLTFLIDDYDPIDHLNAIFSHPSTLSSVSKTSETLQVYQDQLDAEIEDLDTQQAATDTECIKRGARCQDISSPFLSPLISTVCIRDVIIRTRCKKASNPALTRKRGCWL